MPRFLLYLSVLLAFTGWSTWISITEGYWGFLDVFTGGGWSSQVFVDLVISLTLLLGCIKGDARARGIPFWPYALATPFLGSIAPLAYMTHRAWRRLRTPSQPPAE
jgi:hypothetical protein